MSLMGQELYSSELALIRTRGCPVLVELFEKERESSSQKRQEVRSGFVELVRVTHTPSKIADKLRYRDSMLIAEEMVSEVVQHPGDERADVLPLSEPNKAMLNVFASGICRASLMPPFARNPQPRREAIDHLEGSSSVIECRAC